jgi:2-keto-4-pentenoate hydratase/2-oxohepta-3-ene-1,7-dioic acid hydratase in catechol pathway
MRLVSYSTRAGQGFGAVVGDEIAELAGLAPARTIRELIADVPIDLVSDAITHARRIALDSVALLPPVGDPAKIFCVGVNYADHRAETGRAVAEHPTVFTRFSDTHVGHRTPLEKPPGSEAFDYEGELVVVVGMPGFRIEQAQAWGHVFGYSVYNDATERTWQRHTNQWIPGKNFVRSGGFGPWVVTADEVPDITQQQLVTRVDGEVRQRASIANMIFDIPELISYISTFAPLVPGDLIVTGTPGGVGMAMTPPGYLRAGNVVEVSISGVGTLSNPVRDGSGRA